MIPRRVSQSAGSVVQLPELKSHLVVAFDDDDTLIVSLEAAAVPWLDGWHGVLGRCITPQVWTVLLPAGGPHRLPLPDVSHIAVDDGHADLAPDWLEGSVTLSHAANVTMTITPSEHVAQVARQIIKMLVGHWYENRASVVTGTIATQLPLGVEMLLRTIKWNRV